MRSINKVTWVVLLLISLLVLPGCSHNQQVIFDAAMKMQNVNSFQQQTTMTFELSGSGFDPAVQQQVDMAAEYMNNAKLNINVKTSGNDQKTVSKSQVEMNIDLMGMSISVPIWVDSDLNGDNPIITEIIKLPQIATTLLPPQFASKEYLEMNLNEMNNTDISTINLSKLSGLSKSIQSMQIAFLTSYSERFNPDVTIVSKGIQYLKTNDGFQMAELYEMKLNDAQLKDFIRYTVNNFVQDKEAMLFVKELIDTISEVSQVPNENDALSEFDQAFEEFEVNKQEFLDRFNLVMDQLNGVTFLGDQGLELQYAIVGGYVVEKSGTIDLKLDLAQINQLMNSQNIQESMSSNARGTLDLKINFSTVTSDINKPLEIQIPEVNEDNSFDYMDLMNFYTHSWSNSSRLAGLDGYSTARSIGEEFNSGECTSIILASGIKFQDALTSSILSKKFDAPILLVGATVEDSSEAFAYIEAHSNSDTKLFIIGGTGVIGTSFETELIKGGHVNIERIGGLDHYDTALAVALKANVTSDTPVFLISGEDFPDAMSASSFVGSNQYPMLLVRQNYLPDKTRGYFTSNKPSAVYLVGGFSAISQSFEAQIKELVPTASIHRLAGNDRFDTAGAVLNEFSISPQKVYLANGFSFQDSIAGSALAAKTGDPILLIDHTIGTLPPAIESYLKNLRDAGSRPMVRALGGENVVPDSLIKQAESILDGK